MKLFFASDLHGSANAAEQVIAKFRESGADWLILLGDLLYHGPRNAIPDSYNPAAVAELLNSEADKIIAVRGNCDSEVDQMLCQFPITAAWQTVLMPGRRFFLTHGHIFGPDNLPPMAKGDVLAYGHTHIPVAGQVGEHIHFNPGSTTIPRGDGVPSYGLLENDVLSVLTLQGDETLLSVAL